MDLVMIVLITSIVVWKNGYTFYLISKFYKNNNIRQTLINSIFLIDYAIYYYFLYMAATDSIESPLNGPLWLIIVFVILTACNILYDLKLLNIKE
ncbi:hypothetical protein [uncultured Clostridium sp.]|uniref:hypothetical protein n=1 Tax=uncultured Clostridium sp. TaxID=59620 RepID=UPI0025DBFBE6|nr:hypothetical protein [uncultured Clostridium sp.]